MSGLPDIRMMARKSGTPDLRRGEAECSRVVPFARDRLCALARPGLDVTSATLVPGARAVDLPEAIGVAADYA